MPISPAALNKHIVNIVFSVDTICQNIDSKLKQTLPESQRECSDTIFTVEINEIPDMVAHEVKNKYLDSGWSSVIFSSKLNKEDPSIMLTQFILKQ
jgi:hypothetical protein